MEICELKPDIEWGRRIVSYICDGHHDHIASGNTRSEPTSVVIDKDTYSKLQGARVEPNRFVDGGTGHLGTNKAVSLCELL